MRDEIVCICNEVTRGTIEDAIREHGLTTAEQVTESTGAGDVCGSCIADIEDILKELNT